MDMIFNPSGEFRRSPEGPDSQIHFPHLHIGALGSFKIFKVCSDGKERVGAESNGKLPHVFIPSKTTTLVPDFAVEDLPLDSMYVYLVLRAHQHLRLLAPVMK